nr:hypothetical protein Cry52Nrm1_p008 [Cryptomonas curvata]
MKKEIRFKDKKCFIFLKYFFKNFPNMFVFDLVILVIFFFQYQQIFNPVMLYDIFIKLLNGMYRIYLFLSDYLLFNILSNNTIFDPKWNIKLFFFLHSSKSRFKYFHLVISLSFFKLSLELFSKYKKKLSGPLLILKLSNNSKIISNAEYKFKGEPDMFSKNENYMCEINCIKIFIKTLFTIKIGIKIFLYFNEANKNVKHLLFKNEKKKYFNFLRLILSFSFLKIKNIIITKNKKNNKILYFIKYLSNFLNKDRFLLLFRNKICLFKNFLFFELKKKTNNDCFKLGILRICITKRFSDYDNFSSKYFFRIYYIENNLFNTKLNKKENNLFLSSFKYILCTENLHKKTRSKKDPHTHKKILLNIKTKIKIFPDYLYKKVISEKKLALIRFYSSSFFVNDIQSNCLYFFTEIILKFLTWISNLYRSHKILGADPALKKYFRIIQNETFSIIFAIKNFVEFKKLCEKILVWITDQEKEKKLYFGNNNKLNFQWYIFCLEYFIFLLTKFYYPGIQIKIFTFLRISKYLVFLKKHFNIFFNKISLIKYNSNLNKINLHSAILRVVPTNTKK